MQTRPMDDAVDPDLIETSVDISRPADGGVDVLREFSASIGYSVESGPDEIGFVSGWIGWRIDDEDTDPICTAKQTGQDCDEFPFYSSQQGGGLAVPTPSLKAIDGVQNQLQGSKYWSFLSDCHVRDGDPFLVVPVHASATTVPTLRVCNGH
jgi:hypothetical protein